MRSHLLKMLVSEPIPNSSDEEDLGMENLEYSRLKFSMRHEDAILWLIDINIGKFE